MFVDIEAAVALAVNKSPKSAASPADAIVIYSITLVSLGVAPPPKTPLTPLLQALRSAFAAVKSPKSV